MSKPRQIFRHGENLLIRVPRVKGQRVNHRIIGHSETGHHHVMTAESDVELYENNGALYLRVNTDGATVTHEKTTDRHADIQLPKGDYEIKKQREYTPQGWRYVSD